MRLILCQTVSAGGHHPNRFFIIYFFYFVILRHVSALAPSATVHPAVQPPSIHFWTCADNRISGELSKQAVLCCDECRFLGHKSGLSIVFCFFFDCLVSNLTGGKGQKKKKSPGFTKSSGGTNHSLIFVPICLLPGLSVCLVNCQTPGFENRDLSA